MMKLTELDSKIQVAHGNLLIAREHCNEERTWYWYNERERLLEQRYAEATG